MGGRKVWGKITAERFRGIGINEIKVFYVNANVSFLLSMAGSPMIRMTDIERILCLIDRTLAFSVPKDETDCDWCRERLQISQESSVGPTGEELI